MAREIDIVIKGGKVVTPEEIFSAAIGIDGGKIVAVTRDELCPLAKKTIDVSGKYIIPGVVDPECHIGNPRLLEYYFKSETRAAVAAGITTWGLQLTTTNVKKALTTYERPDYIPPWLKVFPTLTELGNQRLARNDYIERSCNDGMA